MWHGHLRTEWAPLEAARGGRVIGRTTLEELLKELSKAILMLSRERVPLLPEEKEFPLMRVEMELIPPASLSDFSSEESRKESARRTMRRLARPARSSGS